MEVEESSASDSSSDDVWAKLVPLNSHYSEIELRSDKVTVCSEIKSFKSEKQDWCKITRNKDQVSAVIQNKSSGSIIVDDTIVQEDDTTLIRCGDKIVLGPKADGFLRYRFKVIPTKEVSKISLDLDQAKCSICLNVWHDVVTVAPCFHNFCNGCLSKWCKTCKEKHANVICPQCRAVVVFVGRNHFLLIIEQYIMHSDSSLRRSTAEIALLDSYASIILPLENSFMRVDPPIPTESVVDAEAEDMNLSVSIVEMMEKVKELRDIIVDMKKQLEDSVKTLKELKAELRKLKTFITTLMCISSLCSWLLSLLKNMW